MRHLASMRVGLAALATGLGFAGGAAAGDAEGVAVTLPRPRAEGEVSVERALALRRSVREFSDAPIGLDAVSQLLWAAQGITGPEGLRTAPSAGALYPLEVYLIAGAVSGLAAGIHHYDPQRHRIVPTVLEDVRAATLKAALEQRWIADAPAILVLAAVQERTARKYGARAARYVQMEVGHAAQNVYLQAAALGLGTCMVGAFHDEQLKEILQLPDEVEVLALMPVGRPR